MHNLGLTRSSQQRNHLLLTADTFVRTTLPGMKGCSAIVHAGPAMGAKFTQYTAEFEAGGELGRAPAQRFIFVIEGEVKLKAEGKQKELGARGYAYFPTGSRHRVVATKPSRVAVIEKPYQALASTPPPRAIISNEDAVPSHPLADDPGLQVKCLLPDEMNFDFATRPWSRHRRERRVETCSTNMRSESVPYEGSRSRSSGACSSSSGC